MAWGAAGCGLWDMGCGCGCSCGMWAMRNHNIVMGSENRLFFPSKSLREPSVKTVVIVTI